MKRILFLLFCISLNLSALSQTNPWWERADFQSNLNTLFLDFEALGIVSAVDSLNKRVYLAGTEISSGTSLLLEYDSTGIQVLAEYFTDVIYDMIVYHGKLYVGSSAVTLYDMSINQLVAGYLFRYDGEVWDNLNITQLDGKVTAFEVIDDTLYVGGEFRNINNQEMPMAARFDGNNWSNIPNNPFGEMPNYISINAFQMYDGDLYLGGKSPDVNDTELLVYQDGNWGEVGTSLSGLYTDIRHLAVLDDGLYVAGVIIEDEGNVSNGIVKWDGTSFQSLGGGIDDLSIFDLEVYEGGLFASGAFSTAGDLNVEGVARWDGAQWCGLRTESPGQVIQDMFVFNDSLYMPLANSPTNPFFNQGNGNFEIFKWKGGDDFGPCSMVTSVSELSESNISIYPNPTMSSITVASQKELIEDAKIYDISGRRVLYKNISGLKRFDLDCNQLMDGTYILEIKSQTEKYRRKFVKQ